MTAKNNIMTKQYFAKSFEDDFVLKTLNGKRKEDFQSIHDVLKTNTINLNTKSFLIQRQNNIFYLYILQFN